MIATDTSSLVAYLKGEKGNDVDLLDSAAMTGQLRLPPVVITEILSDEASSKMLAGVLPDILPLDVLDGFWSRAGKSRRLLKRMGFKPGVADALIAQSCIDHDVALIQRDGDFRQFAKYCGLKLA